MLHISCNFHIILRKALDGKISPGHFDAPGLGGDQNFFPARLQDSPMILNTEETISLQGENRHAKKEIPWQLQPVHEALRFRFVMRFLIGLMAFHSKLYEKTAGPIPRLLVVRLVVHDPVAPVDLLQQDHPHQLMGKGHPGKAELIIRPL